MKLQLDTVQKVIRVDETVNLKEFFNLLNKILPNKEWHGYKLETNTVIQNWINPITITPYIQPNMYPWWQHQPIGTPVYDVRMGVEMPMYKMQTFGGADPNITYATGIYNLEVES